MSVLTLAPDYVYEVTTEYSTLVNKMENGFEQRRPQRSRSIRTFKLVYKTRYLADVTTIQSLFDSSLGQYGTFTFTDPDSGNTYNARFKADTFTKQLKAGQAQTSTAIYDFSFEVLQVLT